MKDNMELWEKVKTTDPKYTKNANVKGNKITAISPQYQIMKATKEFGVYGSTWGFNEIVLDYALKDMGLVTFSGIFFYPLDGKQQSFPIINSVGIYKDGAQTKIDDDFAKKVETDALTKALSKIGFNADVFLGMYDDSKYVDDLKKEEVVKKNGDDQAKAEVIYKAIVTKLMSQTDGDKFKAWWGSELSKAERQELGIYSAELYGKLIKDMKTKCEEFVKGD